MKITCAGVYAMEPSVYHADPVEPLSLSRGIAHLLITHSSRHAHYAHPKLGGNGGIVPTRVMDDGSVVHSLMLGRPQDIGVVDAVYGEKHAKAGEPVTDFATKAAQEARDAIRKQERIPVLPHRLKELRDCAASALHQLEGHQDGAAFFGSGQSEAVVVWREDDLWFRIMVDRLPDDPRAPLYDIKATELSAAPGGWERRLQKIYAFQDAFYRRGLRALRGVEPEPMRFVVVELDPPHCISVVSAAPSLRVIAEREVERAIQIWRRCLTRDEWPGYAPFTAYVEATNWQIAQADEQALRDQFAEEYAA